MGNMETCGGYRPVNEGLSEDPGLPRVIDVRRKQGKMSSVL